MPVKNCDLFLLEVNLKIAKHNACFIVLNFLAAPIYYKILVFLLSLYSLLPSESFFP